MKLQPLSAPSAAALLWAVFSNAHGALVIAQSSAKAGGFTGGYSQSYVGSNAFPLASTPAGTPLITISNVWDNAENSQTTYSQAITGGLTVGSTANDATLAGTITLLHEAGSPRDGAPIWYGSAEPYFDLVLDSETQITASISGTIHPLNPATVRAWSLSVYDWNWNYLRGSDRFESSDSSFDDSWQTTLPAGSYRVAPWAGFQDKANPWGAATAVVDYNIRMVSTVPEPGTLAIGAVFGLGALLRRRR